MLVYIEKPQIYKKNITNIQPTLREPGTNSVSGIRPTKGSQNKGVTIILPEKWIIIEVTQFFFKNQYTLYMNHH